MTVKGSLFDYVENEPNSVSTVVQKKKLAIVTSAFTAVGEAVVDSFNAVSDVMSEGFSELLSCPQKMFGL